MAQLGCCYYPEHWPESQWAEDAQRMVDAGLHWVRIGEFAWSRLEPRFGQFDWLWLDRAINTLGKAGLSVVLSTPTATPPRWMLDRLPNMLAVDDSGQQRKFGSRRHYCFSHQGYKDECQRIVQLMAERYAKHPYVKAWQIDNEYGCHDTVISYSDSAKCQFRIWLMQRYGSIANLNQAWGNIFWSMEYSNFDEIELPNQTVTEANPAQRLDFHRFSSDQVVAFNRLQVDVLRAATDVPLIHNYMGRITDFDHFAVGADLDIASWDSYPLGFLEDRSDEDDDWRLRFARQGDPDFQAFHHDLYRSVGRGRWWVMEQQPGPVNWAPYNPAPLKGMVKLWSLEAVAHGAEAVCYFRWRQLPFAQEQMHTGLLNCDSSAAPGLDEAIQVAAALKDLGQISTVQSDLALVFDYESDWAWRVQPQGASFDYFRLTFSFYRALRQLGLSIDILPASSPTLEGYKLVVIPGLMSLNTQLEAALKIFKGIVVAGPRSGTRNASFHTVSPAPSLAPVGTRTVQYESLRPGLDYSFTEGGKLQDWFERMEAPEDLVAERTTSGWPAMLREGMHCYLCGWPDAKALQRIFSGLAAELGIKTMQLPDQLRIRDTEHYRFWFNYGNEATSFGDIRLEPAGVHIQPKDTI